MSLFDNYNANDLPEENKFGKKQKIVRIKNDPVICKLVPIMNMKDANGKPLLYYPYSRFTFPVLKNGKKENYTRPSLKVKDLNDPQFDKYLELKDRLKTLTKGTQEHSQLEILVKSYQPTRKSIIFVHVLGSSDIQAMEIPDSLNKKLFGSEAWGDKPAEEGLYQSLRRKNINLFDVMSAKGWVKFTRKGTTFMDTEYTVEPYKVTKIVEGEEADVNFSQEVSPSLKELKDTDLPNAKEVAAEYSWTQDEVNVYINTGTVPERIGKKPEAQVTAPQVTPQVAASRPTPIPQPSTDTPLKKTGDAPTTPVTKSGSFEESFEDAFR